MTARYLIRLDDACDTMARRPWAELERVFDRFDIKPIVAVVPENVDTTLVRDERDPAFWDRVRAWEAKGWTIGMHGYQHSMHPTQSRLLVPFYQRSEFAGLSFAAQSAKIRASWQLFAAQGIRPSVWVAPAHSFDRITLQALHAETPIRIVSDGIAWDTFYAHDFHWIPQQMWAFAERRSGLWTVCLHPSEMSDKAIADFERRLANGYRDRMTSVAAVKLRKRSKSLVGRLYHEVFWYRWRKHAATAEYR